TTAGSASAPPGPAPSEPARPAPPNPARPAPPPPGLALLCGRYEGFDQRVHEHLVDDEISIGPYVLAGGELAAMVVADAVIRKLPGALGDQESATEESFSEALGGAPEYPHFTRPESYRGWEVPEILRSGDHGQIEAWRREQSRLRGSAASESSPPAPKR
ncbi:MAG TPA: hypothetical protein VFD37_07770, partial [Solirubrobacterales bacterium]|nr:hypothetical protein [Solirubrobacterales bacterium]